MDRNELNKFAKKEEEKAQTQLIVEKNNIFQKIGQCRDLCQQRGIIPSDKLNDPEVSLEEESCFDNKIIIDFYETVLNDTARSAQKLSDAIKWGEGQYEFKENMSQKHYEDLITDTYVQVIKPFKTVSEYIDKFFQVWIAVFDERFRHCVEQKRNFFVMVTMLIKFIIPVKNMIEVLEDAIENAHRIEQPPSSDPNDNSENDARKALKEKAKILIDHDHEIKIQHGPILNAIVNDSSMTQYIKKQLYALMKSYYQILMSEGLIHLQLCSHSYTVQDHFFKNGLDDQVSVERLKKYCGQLTVLRVDSEKIFNEYVAAIHMELKPEDLIVQTVITD